MDHYDARKAVHDPKPEPRPGRTHPPIAINVEKIAKRIAAGIARLPPDEWSTWERVYVDRLLDRLEERHDPADVDKAAMRFIEVLRKAFASSV